MSDKKNNKTQQANQKPKTPKAPPKKDVKKTVKPNPLKAENELLNKKILNLEAKINDLKDQIKVTNDTYLNKAKELQKGAQAKVEVFKEEHKKNSQKELEHIKKYASSKFFEDFIEPLLNLELAIEAGKTQESDGVKNYVIGFEMLLKQIEDIMESHSVVKINPKIGAKFNPDTMTAFQVVEDKTNADKIIKIKKPGFKLHDRVLKPASVIIGK